jgi:ADP-heptose:LPS heptosyltransferase
MDALADLKELANLDAPAERDKPWCGIARFGGIGDNLMAASVLPMLAQRFRVDVMTNHEYGVVFDNNPWASKITKVRNEDIPHDGMSNWQDWFAKRAREYEHFWNVSHTCENLLALHSSQTAFYWPNGWRRKHCGKSYIEAIADVVDVPYQFGNPLFYPTDEELEKAAETKKKVGEKVIGWCVAGSRLDKYHPLSPIIIGRILREIGLPVIMFGASQREMEVVKATMEHVERANGSIAGLHEARTTYDAGDKGVLLADDRIPEKRTDWPIRRSLTQIMTCDLIIGPDTGLMWASAFERVPKIVLLSHASQENITKYWPQTVSLHADQKRVDCWPCHLLHDTVEFCRSNKNHDGAACISDLSAEMILDAIRTLLECPPDLVALHRRLGANCTIDLHGSWLSQ